MLALLAVLSLAQVPEGADPRFADPQAYTADPDETAPRVEGDDLEAQPAQVPSVDAFFVPLSSYGLWTDIRGVRAWQPLPSLVGADFVPYASGGRWVSTRAGWIFESRFPFGWATFHYGRWWYEDGRGWVWVPDTTWGPAWVDWRMGGGYTGWAPLPPVWLASWHRPRWFFVETPRFCGEELWRHRVGPRFLEQAYRASVGVPPRIHGRERWYAGPRWSEVVRYAPQPPVRRPVSAYYPQHAAAAAGASVAFRPPPVGPPERSWRQAAPPPPVYAPAPSRPMAPPTYAPPPTSAPQRGYAPPPVYAPPPPVHAARPPPPMSAPSPGYSAPPPMYRAPSPPRYESPPGSDRSAPGEAHRSGPAGERNEAPQHGRGGGHLR